MNLTERLRLLMETKKLNISQVSKGASIPYTTLDGVFKKGADNIKLSTLIKLADYFDVSIDYLVGRSDDSEYTIDEYRELESFRNYLLYKREKEV